jgi:uncharacterized DUF497 family protein
MDVHRALIRLRAMIVEGARVSWEIPHAKEQAAKRNVPIFEAERIIRAAVAIVRIDPGPDGSDRWRVRGMDSDKRPVDVVVKPIVRPGGDYLRVIAVIRTDE